MDIENMSFLFIDKITSIFSDKITGSRSFDSDGSWEYVESVAQLCSYHVRWLLNCSKKSFLLKIQDFEIMNPINGETFFYAELMGHSSESYKYRITGKYRGEIILTAVLIIGIMDYENDKLSRYYKEVLKCLIIDSN